MAKPEKKDKKKHFFKDFKAELKKVVWPTPKQVVNNTTAVITIVLITAIIVFALDLCFKVLNKHGINQLRTKLESSNTMEENETLQTETVESENTTQEEEQNNSGENTVENEIAE